jgi:hypothetical protein
MAGPERRGLDRFSDPEHPNFAWFGISPQLTLPGGPSTISLYVVSMPVADVLLFFQGLSPGTGGRLTESLH